MRSPGRTGVRDGARTMHSRPSSVRCGYRSKMVNVTRARTFCDRNYVRCFGNINSDKDFFDPLFVIYPPGLDDQLSLSNHRTIRE